MTGELVGADGIQFGMLIGRVAALEEQMRGVAANVETLVRCEAGRQGAAVLAASETTRGDKRRDRNIALISGAIAGGGLTLLQALSMWWSSRGHP